MEREDKINNIMKTLKKQIDSRYIIDVGPGAEFYMDATREEFDEALARLIEEGYSYANIPIEQVGGGYTNLELLSVPGKDWKRFKEGLKRSNNTFRDRIVFAVEKRRDRMDKANKIKTLVAKGLSNKEIAEETGIAESTVRNLRNLRKFFKSING